MQAQNANIEKKKAGNTTPQKANNNVIEDLMESDGNESPVADLRTMMVRIFEELEKNMQKNSMNI
jgi:hypothetical protein